MEKTHNKSSAAGILVNASYTVAALNVAALLSIFLPDESISCIFVFILVIIVDAVFLTFCANKFKALNTHIQGLEKDLQGSAEQVVNESGEQVINESTE